MHFNKPSFPKRSNLENDRKTNQRMRTGLKGCQESSPTGGGYAKFARGKANVDVVQSKPVNDLSVLICSHCRKHGHATAQCYKLGRQQGVSTALPYGRNHTGCPETVMGSSEEGVMLDSDLCNTGYRPFTTRRFCVSPR